MTYTSLSALERRFGASMLVQLTDRGEIGTGVVDAAVVDQALADTDATIDASLSVRYRLPLQTVPPLVAVLALAIAIHQLHVHAASEKIQKDYEQALRDLRDLATGAKRLDVAGVEPAATETGGVVFTDRARLFTPETLTGFI